jgi:hypothetical protein
MSEAVGDEDLVDRAFDHGTYYIDDHGEPYFASPEEAQDALELERMELEFEDIQEAELWADRDGVDHRGGSP